MTSLARRLRATVWRSALDRGGATSIEYGMIAAVMTVVGFVALPTLTGAINTMLEQAATGLGNSSNQHSGTGTSSPETPDDDGTRDGSEGGGSDTGGGAPNDDDDWIIGSERADTIDAGGGHDRVDGRAGDDMLIGGNGRDTLTGGAGNDILNGGDGSDTAVFAGGLDGYVFHYDAATGALLVSDITPGDGDDGTDTLTDVETLIFDDRAIDVRQIIAGL